MPERIPSEATDSEAFARLQDRLGHHFTDGALLRQALTHPSYMQQVPEAEHNQRLEFLGDAVLGMVLAEQLYNLLPTNTREGTLTRSRSTLAKRTQLAELARELRLGPCLILSASEEANGGRARDSILEDTVEAIIGAIYLDADYPTCRAVVLSWYGDLLARIESASLSHNPKGQLQELVQPKLGNDAITYQVVEESGPDHAKQFRIHVFVNGAFSGEGRGGSKKEAEENAARAALERLAADTELGLG